MFVTLSLIFCLLSDPTQCLTVRPDVRELTMINCQISGQVEGALWVMHHPGYRLERIRCRMGPRELDV